MTQGQVLTDLRIKKIVPPTDKQIEIWDAKISGFGIRVSPKGTKSFILMFRMSGRLRRLTLGRYPVLSLADARDAANKALLEVRQGKDPAYEKKERIRSARHDTFDAAVQKFIEDYAKQYNKSWKETERILNREFLSKWKGRAVASIKKPEIVHAIQVIVKRGSPTQAVRALAAVRKLFNWLVETGELDNSPCNGLRAPVKERSRDRILNDEEILKIYRASDVQGYPFGTITKLLFLTGQRRSEVAGMAWEMIDLEAEIWSIPAEQNKSGRAHEVPLTKMAISVIGEIPRLGRELVFPARHQKSIKAVSGFSKAKKKLDELSSITDWRQHDIRRTVATGMAGFSVQPHVVEKILNHSSGTFRGVAGVYNRFGYIPEMREALEKWSAHILSLQDEI